MHKAIHLFVFLIFSFAISNAQTDLFQDKNNFISDSKKLVEATKNRNQIAAVNTFEANSWNHQLMDDFNKNKVTQITAALIKKGYSFNVLGLAFLNTLSKALANQEMNSNKLNDFFEAISKTIENQEVSALLNFLKTTDLFFDTRKLYFGPNNSLIVDGGKFDFSYAGFDQNVPDPNQQVDPNATEQTQNVNIFNASTAISVDGPVLKLEDVNLQLISRYDTLIIKNTKGSLQLSNGLFIGTQGSIDWSSMGSDMVATTATFQDFSFPVSKNEFRIENATLNSPKQLQNAVQGVLEYAPPTTRSYTATNYPRFTSNSNDVAVNGLIRNVNYLGAFSLIGRKFSSSCVDLKPSTLTYNDGKNSFQVTSQNFVFKDSSVSAYPANIIIFLGSDSISHPGVTFEFQPISKHVVFKREKGPFQYTSFRDTYHGLEYSLDLMEWFIDSDSINLNITSAKRQIPAMFKSTNFFNTTDFQKMINVGNFHPLRILQFYQKKTNAETIYLEELSKFSKLNQQTLGGSMADLDRKGFVKYEAISGRIDLQPKGLLYLQAFEGKSDYDNLYIPSISPVLPNATINLGKDNVMKIRGVERFFVSDSSHVFAIPDNGLVKVYQNRDLYFDGVLVAGYFLFKGSDFQLHYNDFEVRMTKIDTLKFLKSKTKSKSNTSEKQFMNNNLVYSKGTLFINEPSNKSGIKSFPEYPRFDAETGAYVYFTGKEILGGVYDRRIYFKIPPFKTDSVKKGNSKAKYNFKGTFHSGGMFPPFEDQIKVMGDNSLGFVHKVPQEGYSMFNGKAKFFGTLTMNNDGLRGEGQLKYLSSTWYSNDFVFYQDSIVARGTQAKVEERLDSNAFFPDVDISDYELKYYLKKDTLTALNLKYPFDLYKKQLQLEGSISVSPHGLSGSGLLEIKKEKVIAPKIEFYQKNVVARHAVLNSKLPGYTKNSLQVNNVKISFMLKESIANISPEIRGLTGIAFPLCEYATSIENAKWDLSKKMVFMNAEDVNDISKSFFVATNPQYDSLIFNGAEAVYDINKKQLKIDGVPFIKSSDSKIIPDSGKVFIVEEGHMKTLKKARLIIDTLNQYHHLIKAKIDIESRYKFNGSAIYRYASEKGDTIPIPFSNFYTEEQILSKTETLRYTASQGEIYEKDKFFIAPRVLYKGKVKLVANRQSLIFDGLIKMEIHNKELATDWIPYKHDGLVKEFVLKLESPESAAAKAKKDAKKPVNISEAGSEDSTNTAGLEAIIHYSGFFNEVGDYDLYSCLVSHRRSADDHEIFTASGELRYDHDHDQFVVGDAKRLAGLTLASNKFIYDDSLQTLDCQGTFTLARPDLNFSLLATGEARENIKKHAYSIDAMFLLKMNAPTKALDLAGKRISDIFMEQESMKIDTTTPAQQESLMLKIANMGGEKAAKSYQKHIESLGDYKAMYKFVPKLAEGVGLEKVNLVWSNEHKAWYSKGKLKLSNILGIDINAYTDGFMEVKRTEIGDIVTLVLKPNADDWYYFNYQPGRLALLSSDLGFNAAVAAKSKGETGTPTVYTFVLADEAEEALFMKEYYRNYLGRTYDDMTDYQKKREEEKAQPNLEENTDTNPEPVELAPKTKKKGKKAKKIDITAEESETETPVQKTDDTNPEPVEIAPKPAKKDKKAKKTADTIVDEANPTTEELKEEPKKEKAKPEKKKSKKTDITLEETEPATPVIEDTNPEPVEIAPKPAKKSKKKKTKTDEEGVE